MSILSVYYRIKLFFSKDKELYSSLYQLLGFYPRQLEYYRTALAHKSDAYLNREGHHVHNERLEFLGDAILGAVVGDIVYRHYEDKREGFLTVTRSKIVQRETLNTLSHQIGLDRLIRENTSHQSHNENLYGNAFEALFGAIYLDLGYEACMTFFRERIARHYIEIDKVAASEKNYKSRLLEWSQKHRITIEFRLLDQHKEGGNDVFETEVLVQGLPGCRGKGFSKKESHQRAAQATYELLQKQKTFYRNVMEAAKS